MAPSTLVDVIRSSQEFLPAEFHEQHSRLFLPEHLSRFSERLHDWATSGVPEGFPLPHFVAEVTPPLATAWEPFREIMQLWVSSTNPDASSMAKAFAASLVAAGTRPILMVLGQRFTPASILDHRGIPPSIEELLLSALRPYSEKDSLSVAARALAKHVNRESGDFWGEIKGSVHEKNERASQLVRTILEGRTWCNIFGHYQHDLVFEARLPGGHGVRWHLAPNEFIGFLEPFDDGQYPPGRDKQQEQEPEQEQG